MSAFERVTAVAIVWGDGGVSNQRFTLQPDLAIILPQEWKFFHCEQPGALWNQCTLQCCAG